MPHHRVGPDLSFLHKEMQPGLDALVLGWGVSMNKPPMLISLTRETCSCSRHCQYTHTSPRAGTRDVNLLDGVATGREGGFTGNMVLKGRSANSSQASDHDSSVKDPLIVSRRKMRRSRSASVPPRC